MKKAKIIVSMMMILCFITGCVTKSTTNSKDTTADSTSLCKLSKVRETAQSDYESAKKENSMFTYDDFQVTMTEENEIHNVITIYKTTTASGKNNILDLVNEQVDLMKQYLRSDKFATSNIFICLSKGEDYPQPNYGEEFLRDLENGKYDGYEINTIYYEDLDNIELYWQADIDYTTVWMSRGLLNQKISSASRTIATGAFAYGEGAEKEYYRNATDGSLDDNYHLNNGDMTIQEGIDYVEEYVNHNLPFEKKDETTVEVDKVLACPVGDNTYELCFSLVRSYEGTRFDGAVDFKSQSIGGIDIKNYRYEFGGIAMFQTDDVEYMCLDVINYPVTVTGDAITEVLPLSSAIQRLKDKLQGTSNYQVHSIELSYRARHIDETTFDCESYLTWKFETTNTTDDKLTIFYVNALTGEIENSFY